MADYKTPAEVLANVPPFAPDGSPNAAVMEAIMKRAEFLDKYSSKIIPIVTRNGLILAHPSWKDTNVVISEAARYQIAAVAAKLYDEKYSPYLCAIDFPFYQVWKDGVQLPNRFE
jgi:hypothetical protein